VSDEDPRRRFERLALPHLDAAYNLARWLLRDDHDAQDAVQEAWLRALRYFESFRGEQVRPWLLQIVRHCCYAWMETHRGAQWVALDDDDEHMQIPAPASDEPYAVAVRKADRERINAALADLPVAYREVIVLRELEELPYKDIARIAGVPIGTVMSRLARARAQLREALAPSARSVVLRTVQGKAAP